MSLDLPESSFTTRYPIRFSDCDPAGIVFYAAFFRMFNNVFEDWITNHLEVEFAPLFLREERMFPLMHVSVDFKAPRQMGQTIDFTLILKRLGRSSIHYDIIGHDEGLEVLRGAFVSCVASKKTMSSIAIPAELRCRMEEYLQACVH